MLRYPALTTTQETELLVELDEPFFGGLLRLVAEDILVGPLPRQIVARGTVRYGPGPDRQGVPIGLDEPFRPGLHSTHHTPIEHNQFVKGPTRSPRPSVFQVT